MTGESFYSVVNYFLNITAYTSTTDWDMRKINVVSGSKL